jgi:hypothetical protein
MINYSTNINTTNNYLSPQIIEHKNKRPGHMTLDRHKNVVGLPSLPHFIQWNLSKTQTLNKQESSINRSFNKVPM